MYCLSMPLPCDQTGVYARLRSRSGLTLILDSSWEPRLDSLRPLSRQCIIAQNPFAILTARGSHAVLEWEGGRREQGETFSLLRRLLADFQLPGQDSPTPFPAGAMGYFGYELKSTLEAVPSALPADLDMPDLWLGFFDSAVTLDLEEDQLHITSTGLPLRGAAARERAVRRAEDLRAQLFDPGTRGGALVEGSTAGYSPFCQRGIGVQSGSNFRCEEYLRAILRIKEHIAAGDIYQANLSQRFKRPFEGDSFDLFLDLRERTPAPFSAYLDARDFSIVSASPERFLHFDPGSRLVSTRPIKGTRPRGETPSLDRSLARELAGSEKDHAEHVMIVDLERNDLGKVAEVGSVRVPEFAVVETFPAVFHLTSTVEALLSPEKDAVDLLKAAFPGGSVTGAPKIRSMEIIEQVETVRRGAYTGSLGYLSFSGEVDLNILIRTICTQGGVASLHSGSAIVADSDPESEYQETLIKAQALSQALDRSGRNLNPSPSRVSQAVLTEP